MDFDHGRSNINPTVNGGLQLIKIILNYIYLLKKRVLEIII